MLDSYLEKNIQNKLKLFNILYSKDSATMNDILSFLPLSIDGIHTLVNELNLDFAGLATIEKHAPYFIIHRYHDATFMELLHTIYQSSDVLHCLKFMILNEENSSLTAFSQNRSLSKSAAYRIKEKCGNYLQRVGLLLNGNQVAGDEYRIRFLTALLHYKFGITCYPINNTDIYLTREFILSTNSAIDSVHLEATSNEYGYFEYLFMLLWKRKKFLVAPIVSKELEDLKELFIYEKLKTALKNFEVNQDIHLSDFDYDYIYLVYCATNNCLFGDQWTKQEVEHLYRIVFSDPAFYNLLQRIEKKLCKEIADSHVLKSSLIYFYKKCLLELQCIIPNKNFYLDSEKSHLTQIVFEAVFDNLEDWRKKQNRLYEIDNGHIFYLALQVELIITQFLPPVPVFVLSDLAPELEITTLYLRRLFPPQRATICPFYVGTDNKELLCSQKRSVIIANKKFKYLIEEWKLSEYNTVIPITVELNTQELINIKKAIAYYETGYFLDYVHQI